MKLKNLRTHRLLFSTLAFLLSCEGDILVLETSQNERPEASLIAVGTCVSVNDEVVLDASGSTDDWTDAGSLEFQLDWDSDGVYDTPWSRDPIFSHSLPAGIHTARVLVRDEGFLTSSASCTFVVVPENLPVTVHIQWYRFSAFFDFNHPVQDPVRMTMSIELENDSELWLRDMTINVSVHDSFSDEKIAELPLELTKDGMTWDGMIPSGNAIELLANKITSDVPLFVPPCGDVVYLDVCISGSECWDPVHILTAPFVFYCVSG